MLIRKQAWLLAILCLVSLNQLFGQGLLRPNIVLVMADDHAVNAISTYGSQLIQTPNIDRIAEEGMLFENCFSTNSICNPSRASIMTGKYSHIHGHTTNYSSPGNDHLTYPELLAKAGYQTALIGKTHYWEETNCIKSLDHYMISHGAEYHNPKFLEKGGEIKNYEGYVTDIVTENGLDWLKNCDKSKPFMLMLHHPAPHMPFQEKEELLELYKNKSYPEPFSFNDSSKNQIGSPRPFNITMEGLMGFQGRKHVWGDFAWEPPACLQGEELRKWIYQRYMRAYMACVQSLDENVGRVLGYLEETGLDKNTVVIYTSDQGFFLGEHGWYDKRFFYEESIRMPLMIRYPGIEQGNRNANMVLNIDFPLTILDMAGVPIPPDMQGESLLPLILNQQGIEWRKAMYYHFYESRDDSPLPVRKHYGIRTERYKLICFYDETGEQWELFDLKKDPYEMHNLIREKECQSLISQLKIQLKELGSKYGVQTSSMDSDIEIPRLARAARTGL